VLVRGSFDPSTKERDCFRKLNITESGSCESIVQPHGLEKIVLASGSPSLWRRLNLAHFAQRRKHKFFCTSLELNFGVGVVLALMLVMLCWKFFTNWR